MSEIMKGIDLAEPATIEREEYIDGFSFRVIEAVRAFRRVIRRLINHTVHIVMESDVV